MSRTTSLAEQLRASGACNSLNGLYVVVYATDGTHPGARVCEGQIGLTCRPDDALEVRSLIFDAEGIRMHADSGGRSWDFIYVPGEPWPSPRSKLRM